MTGLPDEISRAYSEIPQHIIEAAAKADYEHHWPPGGFAPNWEDMVDYLFQVQLRNTAWDILTRVWFEIKAHLKGEGEWQYGVQVENYGWVPEPRGENYALMRRKVWYGEPEWVNGQPIAKVNDAETD